jgi:hypothetical protein
MVHARWLEVGIGWRRAPEDAGSPVAESLRKPWIFARRTSAAQPTSGCRVGAIELDNLRATADWCAEAGWWIELAAMCQRLWYFITGAAPVDGTTWYQQFIDHGTALDDQVVADSLGELAFVQVMNFGNYAAGIARSEQSRELADAHGLHEPAVAWIATTFAAMFTGEHTTALHASERALAAAEARGDERVAVVALCAQTSPLAAMGEFEHCVDVGAEAMRRAEQLGQPSIIAAAVVTAASLHFVNPQGLDFATCLEVLTSHPAGVYGGATNAMWLDVTWGTAEVGLGQHGAVGHLTRAARAADQLHSLHAFDLVLRFLALAAAEAGLVEHARARLLYRRELAPVLDPESATSLGSGTPRPGPCRPPGTTARSCASPRRDHATDHRYRGCAHLRPR